MRKATKIIFLFGLTVLFIIPLLQAEESVAYTRYKEVQAKNAALWQEAQDPKTLKAEEAKILDFMKEEIPNAYKNAASMKEKTTEYWQILASAKIQMKTLENLKNNQPAAYTRYKEVQAKNAALWQEAQDPKTLKAEEAKILDFMKEEMPDAYKNTASMK
ncbi:MAG: hypothetical protein PHT41_00800, partial [Candidatus Omnitrophica bacterium]|nr:hypothetical protein [Candidatus Omnitrophota bacterium]